MNIFQRELSNNRIYGLDIVRFFAIIFVVISHGEYLIPKEYRYINTFLYIDGVNVFFVLSGFLIGKSLITQITNNEFNIKNIKVFFIRRWAKTLPSYFLVFIVLLILNIIFNSRFTLYDKLKYIVFSQNINTPHPSFFGEAWSLSIEEWFYLILPIIIFILYKLNLLKSSIKSILYSSILIVILVTSYRLYRYYHLNIICFEEWDRYFRKQVITRFDGIVYGVIAAYFHCNNKEKWKKHIKPLFYLGILILISSKFYLYYFSNDSSLYNCVFSFSFFAIGVGFTIPYLSEIKKGSGLLYKSITKISIISYSIYLLNLGIVRQWIIENIDLKNIPMSENKINLLKYLSFWIITLILSYYFHKYFENKLQKKLINFFIKIK